MFENTLKMTRVLLVQPHRDLKKKSKEKYSAPYSLMWVAAPLKNKHPVKIYDRNVNLDDSLFFDFIKKFNPDIIGFTAMTSSMLLDIIYLGPLIKKKFPNLIIIVGGVHPTIEPDSVLRESFVDYIIRGEADDAFLEFCDVFDKDPKKIKKLRNINKNPLRKFLNIKNLEFPSFDLIDIKKYSQIFLSTSRGCPGTCNFCYNVQMWGEKGHPCVRFYDIEKTKKMFKEVIDKGGVTEFTISDENFMTFKKRCIELCNFLEKNYKNKISFFVFGRADFVNPEVLGALKKAGCNTIQLGSESGSQRVLDFLNKKITVKKQGEALKLINKFGIFNDASFMVGIPTETTKEMKMTENFIKKFKPDIADVKIFNPLPGSKIFDDLVKEGKITKPQTLKEWADWTGDLKTIKHNFSEIPNNLLEKTAEKFWNYRYYQTRIKKAIYWVKRGNVEHVLKKFKKITRKYSGSQSWS